MKWDWQAFEGSREMLRYMRRDVSLLKQTVEAHVPRTRRRVAVQAGGALGMFPKFLAGRFATVYTFEPDPENFAALMRNAPERNIVKFQAALGDRRALVAISHERRSRKPGTAHEGIRHVDGPGPIPTLTVDDLGLNACDLLYLDVEGHELFALRGAVATIARCAPVIVAEFNEMAGYVGVTEQEFHAQLDAYGYDCGGLVSSSDLVFTPREAARRGAS